MIDRLRLAELRDEVGTDDLAEVVGLFCEEVEETLARLQSQACGVDPEDLHFLKGSALNIGLSEVGKLCQQAELKLRVEPSNPLSISDIELAYLRSKKALYAELK